MTTATHKAKSGFSYGTIWRIAYPIMFGNLAQTLITLTDTAFLGRLSEVALGASAIAGIYYYVFSTLAWGFAIGMQVIVARRFGEGSYSRIGSVFEHGLAFVGVLGLLLFSMLMYLSPVILDVLIDSPNVYREACVYMTYRPWGIIFVCFNFLYRSLYIGLSNTKIISYTTALMAVVNIVGDYALIFGNLGMPALGVGGAAIASVAAEISATIFFTVFTLTKIPFRKYGLFRFEKLRLSMFGDIFGVAMPTMLQKLLSFGTWLIFFAMVERLGERALAISMTVRSVYMFITIPVFAFGAAAGSLTSRIIGEGRYKEVRRMTVKILKICFAVVLPMSALCFVIPHQLLGIYTDNAELIAESVSSLHTVALCAFALGFGQIYFDTISGTGNTSHALMLETGVLVCYAGYVMFSAQVLGGPVSVVWISEGIYGAVLGLLSVIYMRSGVWQKKRI